MTDVAQAVLNGDGETSTGGLDKSSSTTIKEETSTDEPQSPLGDILNNDNVSTAETEEFQAMDTSDSNQFVEQDNDLNNKTSFDGKDETVVVKTEIQNALNLNDEEGDDLVIGDDNNDTEPEDENTESTTTRHVILEKVEPDDNENAVNQQTDEDGLEGEQNSNSAEDSSEQVLLNCNNSRSKDGDEDDNNPLDSGAKSASVSNGEKEEEMELGSDHSLLTGLLLNKDHSLKPQSSTVLAATSPSSSSHNFSVNDGNAIAKDLEEQVEKLAHLLILKEQEWGAILKLKKHLEFALEQVKCTQRISKIQESMDQPLLNVDITACMNLIVSDKDLFTMAERQIEESIESTENENESLQTIFPFKSQSSQQGKEDCSPLKLAKNNFSKKSFTASAALKSLCERKRKAMDELTTPGRAPGLRLNTADVQNSSGQQVQSSKVIGNGRKGAIVDVQSIIQSHRNSGNSKQDSPKRLKKPSYTQMIHMNPERQYEKTLAELMSMCEADNKTQKESPALPVPNSSLIAAYKQLNNAASFEKPFKSKNGKPLRPGSNNSLLHGNPTPSGSGTLAKMLSPSTHSSIGAHRSSSNDTSSSSQKFGNKIANTDSNLSLANLLATSKMDSKINISKINKKERDRGIRDEEPSSVPSQQADTVPICQGCNLSRAQFVCAGCANQWYCSRECQVAAWDEHSDICSG